MESGYNKYMMLKIRYVRPQDFGSYRCVAKNSLGETDGVIKLEGERLKIFPQTFSSSHYDDAISEIPAPTTVKTTTAPSTTMTAKNKGESGAFFANETKTSHGNFHQHKSFDPQTKQRKKIKQSRVSFYLACSKAKNFIERCRKVKRTRMFYSGAFVSSLPMIVEPFYQISSLVRPEHYHK